MTAEPTVLVCVGSHKAGTTWLYRYLAAHPECAPRRVKELHYFDTVEFEDQWPIRMHERMLKAAKSPDTRRDTQAAIDLIRQGLAAKAATGRIETGDYLDFLRGAAGPDTRLVADITPAYALLPEERLAQIAAMAPGVQVLFILRDPVDRLWSHLRMAARKADVAGSDAADFTSRALDDLLNGKGERSIRERSDYAGIVSRLLASVPRDRLILPYYEDLMTDDGIRGLCRTLGLSPVAPDLDQRVHQGIELQMTEAQRQRMAQFLLPHYRFAQDRLGPLPAAWTKNMEKGLA